VDAAADQLLKISEEDLGLVMPDAVPHEFARAALAQGVSLVVVTRGGEGRARLDVEGAGTGRAGRGAGGRHRGAGDTFQAALLTVAGRARPAGGDAMAALSAEELADALQFASRAAAITCSRRGADLPRRAELG
jgi:fructokinase